MRFEKFPFNCIGNDVFIETENSKIRFQTDVRYNAYGALEKYSVQWGLLQTDIAREITMDITVQNFEKACRLLRRDARRIEKIKKIFAPGYKTYISDPKNIKYEL